MKEDSQERTRADVLRQIVMLPALAAAFAGGALPAVAATDNKAQFKYQNKPGVNGEKCSGCALFKPPSACTLVTGKISPNGWCTAWAKKQ